MGNGRQARQNLILNLGEVREFLFCFVLLSLLAHLGCTERSVRLASTIITSTPRSVNDVEVRSISNLLVGELFLLQKLNAINFVVRSILS